MATTINPPRALNSTPIIAQPHAPVLQLPHEVTTRILALLPAQEIGTATLVCREWCWMFEHDETFRSIFSYQFPNIDEKTVGNCKNFYHFYSNLTKEVYASRTFHGHANPVCSLALAGETLFSGSYDKTIKAWDIKVGKCVATFQGHASWVCSLAVAGETLFSGSADHTIKAWDIKTGKCIATFQGHEGTVRSLAVAGETLFSGSNDSTIKAWDIKTGKCVATLQGHRNWVRSLAVAGETLFSGSNDNTIKAWDIKTGECIATFQGHKKSVCSLAVAGETLFSGSDDKTIKAWDIKTGKCVATFQEHTNLVCSLAVAGETLFSGSDDKTIKAWDIKTGKCIATFQEHAHWISSVAVAGETLFSGSSDDRIKAWDFTADHTTIFIELAKLLETGKPEEVKQALGRFSKMPIRARNTICKILHDILDETEISAKGIGATLTIDEIDKRAARPEDIFYDKCEQRKATSAQKAQAIFEYLIIASLHQEGSSGFSTTGKRTYDTAFGTEQSLSPSPSSDKKPK